MSKALGLISGGLDSVLAAMTLMRQGVEVTGVAFVTPFFGADKARAAAETIGFPLIVKDISAVHLEMLKNPHYGYGRNMNPCIDCHALMFRLAGEIMEQQRFDFLFSGEVLGQRPMSQNANALKAVANYSGYPERVLRPLSAKLLSSTSMEEEGLVDRSRLLDIQGRSRRRQQALAIEWGFPNFPTSGGGCLLTEVGFSNRLRDLLQYTPAASVNDTELLKVGRHFRISPTSKLILGRNQEDNERLQQLAEAGHLKMHCRDFSGPLGLFCGEGTEEDFKKAAAILASYGKGKEASEVNVLFSSQEQGFALSIAPMPRAASRQLLLA